MRVEQASRRTEGLAQQLVEMPEVRGALVLSTCNRVEVLIDVKPKRCLAPYKIFVSDVLDGPTPADLRVVPIRERRDIDAIRHIFRIAAGLDSMVVGEREISGQLRRALRVAHQENTASATITRVCQDALSSSRKIAQLTGLASQGRSVVNIGLDLVEKVRHLSDSTKALIVGTGSYAGATVAALRARNVHDISVYSHSGRAHAFATGHDLTPVDDLENSMKDCDIVITCSGRGTPIVTKEKVTNARWHRSSDLVFLDLALQRDVEDAVYDMPGVFVINLDDIQQSVPEAHAKQLRRAQEIVDEGVEKVVDLIRSRRMDPIVVALRDSINAVLTDELQRLPDGDKIDRNEAEHALRRLAARLAHTPSIRAREAAQHGRAKQFVEAIHQVMGVDISDEDARYATMPQSSATPGAQPEALIPSPKDVDDGVCPITGLQLADLGIDDDKATTRPKNQEAV